jgi:hypothetical protein
MKLWTYAIGVGVKNQTHSASMQRGDANKNASAGAGLPSWDFKTILESWVKKKTRTAKGVSILQM